MMTFARRLALMLAATTLIASTAAAQDATSLGALVGVWQSDTTNGVSAVSHCGWTPEHAGVVCEQTIRSPDGERRVLNVFTFDPAAKRFVFYAITHPGDALSPVALSIQGPIWIYGGVAAGANGVTYRTVNDFSKPGVYTWRSESSKDGREWTVGAHGRSRRLR